MNGAGGALRPWHTWVLDQPSMTCTVVHDESAESLDVGAFSMHRAQREIIGYLMGSMLNEDRSGPCAI